MKAKTYSEKLRDPRWQKKRLEVLEAAGWKCSACRAGDTTLHVHHGFYERGREPWDYHNDSLHAVCESCHDEFEQARKSLYVVLGELCLSDLKKVLGYAVAQVHDIEANVNRNVAPFADFALLCGIADACEHLTQEQIVESYVRAADYFEAQGRHPNGTDTP